MIKTLIIALLGAIGGIALTVIGAVIALFIDYLRNGSRFTL